MDNIFEFTDSFSRISSIPTINIYGRKIEDSKKKLFTIAIPTYKRASTLLETIESALNQIDVEDYNVIVVDNNPERGDETEKLMQKYIDNFRVYYFKNSENVGMAGNWNKCLELSLSNQMILLHDDDILSPYALRTFETIISYIDDDWAMVKPNLISFENQHSLEFNKVYEANLYPLSLFHFFDGCMIGAPTCILVNKKNLISLGAYNQEYFPSFDYVAAVKATYYKKTYTISTKNPIGGYRVSNNESLKESTMDSYFIARYEIGRQVMKKVGIPSFIIKLYHSARFKDDVRRTCEYYNYCDYEIKTNNFDFYQIPDNICRFIYSCRGMILQVLSVIKRKKIKIKC